jgi:hypothetical protein
MSFAQVRQLEGQKDQSGYDVKFTLPCTVGQILPVEFNKTGKKIQKVTLIDSLGEQQKVTLYAGNAELPPNLFNTTQTFSLSSYRTQRGLFYSGFWNNQTSAQQPQQAAPQPRQAPNAPKPAQTSQYDTNASICRQCAGKCVAELLAGQTININDVLELAIPLSEWFLTGKKPALVTREPGDDDEPPVGDDAVPFQ